MKRNYAFILWLVALLAVACRTDSHAPNVDAGAGAPHKLGSVIIPQQAGDFWVNQTASTTPTLQATQTGTLVAPNAYTAWKIQPRDPAKAPYETYLAGGLFNSTWDDTLAWGYNADLLNLTEPAAYTRLEQDYEVSPGVHWFEWYLEYFLVNRSITSRPIYINVDRASGKDVVQFSLFNSSSTFNVTDQSGNAFLQTVSAGTFFKNNYQIFGYDSGATGRNLMYVTSGDYMVAGDFALPNSLIIRGGAGGGGLGGIILESGPTGLTSLYDANNANAAQWALNATGTTSLTFATGVTSAKITQAAAAGAPNAMSITAQAAGGTNDGAAVVLSGGAHAGSGTVDGSTKVLSPLNGGFLAYTFASDANQTFTNAQSDANFVVIAAGVTTAPRTITLTRRAADTSCLWVKNNNAQTVNFGFLTGSTIAVATTTSALVCADGTNAVKVMTGT